MTPDPANQTAAKTAPNAVATFKLIRRDDSDASMLVLGAPHSDYQLHLVCEQSVDTEIGKRIKGTVEADALRIHPSDGGGRFIEPLWGSPRILAGFVKHVDESHRRVLVDCAVPVWITTPEQQDFSVIREGELVNFYVQSGARFVPSAD